MTTTRKRALPDWLRTVSILKCFDAKTFVSFTKLEKIGFSIGDASRQMRSATLQNELHREFITVESIGHRKFGIERETGHR